eukprot:gene8476-3587_t
MADLVKTEIVDPLPTFEEFSKVSVATAVGFAIIGFIGFIVKLIFIPINNVIIGQ